MHDSPLGRVVATSTDYAPQLLFPIARASARSALGLADALPFHGVDIWNAYELSWLDARGKPCIALGEFRVPATSANLIESKSLKLYLGSLQQTRFDDRDGVAALIARDLAQAAGAEVDVVLTPANHAEDAPLVNLAGESIDDLDIAIDDYGPPRPDHLHTHADPVAVTETLVSHLLKTNCPVTGQPDWASVQIRYRGARIERAGLLRYLVSFRGHDDFHEQCVERIFVDLQRRCAPTQLSVYARYTRRGGLDINPWRSTLADAAPDNPRGVRQ